MRKNTLLNAIGRTISDVESRHHEDGATLDAVQTNDQDNSSKNI
jgi:hypothetical protein